MCDRTGKVDEETCVSCGGSGVVMDNRVMDTIIEHYPGDHKAKAIAARCATSIHQIYEAKLEEAYQAGVKSGKELKHE